MDEFNIIEKKKKDLCIYLGLGRTDVLTMVNTFLTRNHKWC